MSTPEPIHLALNFRDTACGTSEDFIDMTQDRSAVTCSACIHDVSNPPVPTLTTNETREDT